MLKCPKRIKFIKRANEIHNNKYDYSKVIFKTNKDKVIIICPIHGDFEQIPANHIYCKSNCLKCGYKNRKSRKLKLETFIEKSNKIHNNKYDYSKVNYINYHTNICIICPIHGKFNKLPKHHIKGSGCIKCIKNSHSEKQIEWLNKLSKKNNIYIQHYMNDGEYSIKLLNNKITKVDGFCKKNNTVYEFHGCFWHGCPKCFPNRNDINPKSKKIYKNLYENTLLRDDLIRKSGYNLITLWECDFI